MGKRVGQNHGIRYSEAFKMAVVRELESEDLPFEEMRRKYGILGTVTVQKWVRKENSGSDLNLLHFRLTLRRCRAFP